MAYVREKHYRARDGSLHVYYQLVESYRAGGRPRQRVLVHLGAQPSVELALADLERRIAGMVATLERYQAQAARLEATAPPYARLPDGSIRPWPAHKSRGRPVRSRGMTYEYQQCGEVIADSAQRLQQLEAQRAALLKLQEAMVVPKNLTPATDC